MISYSDMQAVREADLPSHAKHVLIELLYRASPDRRICWPSLSTIASDTSLSKATVRRMLRLLEEREFIEVQRNPTGGSNNYLIYDLGGYHSDTPHVTQAMGHVTQDTPHVTQAMGHVTVTGHERERKRKESETKKDPPLDSQDDLAERIQNLWNQKLREEFRIDILSELLINHTPEQIESTLDKMQAPQIAAHRADRYGLERILRRDYPQ